MIKVHDTSQIYILRSVNNMGFVGGFLLGALTASILIVVIACAMSIGEDDEK